ncbi:MAG: DUF1501 domain-containing protein [Candidatus Omnitrophica bacterium]|nr:DUF1501 domain-containing protein [Candidatus Omnitrophota bacterium]
MAPLMAKNWSLLSETKLSRRQFLLISLKGIAFACLSRFAGLSFAFPEKKFGGKARSVIQIWMWGGPAHLDTFDPKPEAGRNYCGPLDKPIPTNVDGIRISQLLPLLAQQADKFSIIRSMTHGINGHETAAYRMQTGREPGGTLVYPSLGAVTSLFKGYDFGYQDTIPPYIVLTTSQGRFSETGFLGPKYQPLVTGGDPNRDPFLVEGFVLQGISREKQVQRRQLAEAFDRLAKVYPEHPLCQKFEETTAKAYESVLGEAIKVFDLTLEKAESRERYGRTWFGQACLAARRLVERGVPYVTINYPGWDTHKRHFETIQRMMPDLDRGMSTLLVDLTERGLLQQTIVWWSGEFGRTPRIQWEAPWYGGRNHYGRCFSVVVAGGGFKGGKVLGRSNRTGEEVEDRPVYPEDLLGSLYELLGIDPDGLLPNPRNLKVPVMLPPRAGRLHEIMA